MIETRQQHLSLLCDIGELSNLMTESEDINSFLQQTVQLVASHLYAEVGSIYLYDAAQNDLTLKATVGLDPLSVGRVRMKIGEGLVGTTMEQMSPLCDGEACLNPRFKYFVETKEDPFNSFLSVPIHRGSEKIGVLVVQHRQANYFKQADIMALRALAAQLAGTIANARQMIDLKTPHVKSRSMDHILETLRFVKGEATATGYALAPAALLKPVDPLLLDLPEEAFHDSLNAYVRARQETLQQLKRLQERLVMQLPESAALIFEAHYMILKDPRFDEQIASLIRQGGTTAEAVRQAARHFIRIFDTSPSPYIREKAQDILDLARRLLFNLQKVKTGNASPIDAHIVISSQLFPSDVLKLASESVAGIILVGGGVTSHVAIIARSLKIPMIIATETDLLHLPEGVRILMDAEVGNIYINPSEEVRRPFEERNQTRRYLAGEIESVKPETYTADGVRVHLLANINLLSELGLARELKAEGVGLYRSEFPFIVRSVLPSEEEQYQVYTHLFEQMEGLPIHIRALDVGGDKVLPYLNLPQEANPELGLRSIRFLLKHRDVFDQQLRAILRAGADAAHLGIMFPMISSLDEFEAASHTLQQSINALSAEGTDHHPHPMIGAMIEMPSVLTVIDELAEKADFFSIGTNDFIQYMLAVDRTNENVADYYRPFHPSILRALAHIVDRVSARRKPIFVCGEVAYDPEFIPFLVGIGVRRLSVAPQFIPTVQKTIASISISDSQAYARTLLAASTLSQVDAERARWQDRASGSLQSAALG